MVGDALPRKVVVFQIELDAGAIPAPSRRRQIRCSSADKGVEHGVTDKRKHSNRNLVGAVSSPQSGKPLAELQPPRAQVGLRGFGTRVLNRMVIPFHTVSPRQIGVATMPEFS